MGTTTDTSRGTKKLSKEQKERFERLEKQRQEIEQRRNEK